MRNSRRTWVMAWSAALAVAGCGSGSASTTGPASDAGAGAEAAIDAQMPAEAGPVADAGLPADAQADADAPHDAVADAAGTVEVAYVSTYLGGIYAFTVDPATGAPSPIAGSPFEPGAHLYSVALHPSQSFLYAADLDGNAVHAFAVAPGGGLVPVPGSPFASAGNPIAVATDPLGRFVYVANSNGKSLAVFHVDPASGALAPVQAPPSPLPTIVTFVAAEPSGRFVYTTGTGAGIHAFAVDASGALAEVAGSPFGTGAVSGGGGLCVHPGGAYLFGGDLSDLTAFAIDPGSGALGVVPGSPFATVGHSDPNAIDVAVDPTGRRVYGIDSAAGTLSVLAVDVDSGALTPIAQSPIDAGSLPYSVAVDPSGRYVYVGNDDVGQLSVYAIDPASGRPTPIAGSPFTPDGLQPQIVIARVPAGT